ncbi:MarR family winged helix-turn-helix transcriptional regulator [Nocardiopsis aegyptia]|uniref:DNA-binding MarR family transcriptional regulator n=1 Tax=Nocardiopsis aegyptia TaxID=220378 RepID=A0A7Z0EIU9_9ACTN|nr:MarR family transcriptional regulator [Nocardiopsis aegyptia]NYJ32900.1 DNA-binding MarR family transcriptional regulator [Nocardiopsis aegyptia]
MDHDRDFGVLVGRAFQRMVAELHAHLAEAGFAALGQSLGFAIKEVAAAGADGLTTARLAARMGVTHQGAAKAVDEMVAAGYVRRVPDPQDGRSKRLVLTDHGRALLAAGHAFHQDYERRLADRVGPEHVAAAREVLAAMRGMEAPREEAATGRAPRPLI